MRSTAAPILTPDEFGELTELIGTDEAKLALDNLLQRKLSNESADLLRAFLVLPLLTDQESLRGTLSHFKKADRYVQALAIMGLRLDIRHRLSGAPGPQPYLRLIAQGSVPKQDSLPNQALGQAMSTLLSRAQEAWGKCEAHRRAVAIIFKLDFPSYSPRSKSGYTGEDEKTWRKLLTTIHEESQQLRAYELIAYILRYPQQVVPSRRRISDNLPDVAAILNDLLNIQSGGSTAPELTEHFGKSNLEISPLVAVESKDLSEIPTERLLGCINRNEVTKAAQQFRQVGSSDQFGKALETFLWRRHQLLSAPLAEQPERLRALETDFFNRPILKPENHSTPTFSLEVLQEQLLAYLRSCKTQKERASSTRAILHETLDGHWARQVTEVQGVEEIKRLLKIETETMTEQARRTTERIVNFADLTQGALTQEELHSKEALLAGLTQKMKNILKVADKSLDETRQALWEEANKVASFRILAATDLRRGASLLRELKEQNETGIVIRRGKKQERALIKPYKDGDLYDSEEFTKDLTTAAGSLIKRASGGERILIREGHGHVPIAVFAPSTSVVDAYLVRTGHLSKENSS